MSGPTRHTFEQHRSDDPATGDPIDVGKVPTADGASGWTFSTPASSSLTIKDEGTPLATAATSIDFVGAGVTASGTGAAKTVTIPGFGWKNVMVLDPTSGNYLPVTTGAGEAVYTETL